ncbi:hypothetical protein CK489_16670 [Bradyrhizobium sp. UFLA03-84]|nr:hypothetical protein CK489_16670 [Bradyrhizobium sp. UFLA03-84]
MLKRARQAETAARMSEWLRSPGHLRPRTDGFRGFTTLSRSTLFFTVGSPAVLSVEVSWTTWHCVT